MAPRPTTSSTTSTRAAAAKPNSTLSPRRPSISLLSRNVDTVVLGNVQFETWYYSPYPDSLIISAEPGASSSAAATTRAGGEDDTSQNHNGRRLNGGAAAAASTSAASSISSSSTGPRNTKVAARTTTSLIPVLHVCPFCFRYTPHVSEYVAHVQSEQRPRSENLEASPVPESATLVYSYDGYRVWEVDGETEKLYCQNLSLFGKLFLEQKSVFFDTGGFLYYVLTYTPPPSQPEEENGLVESQRGQQQLSGRAVGTSGESDHIKSMTMTEVLGFFSKENNSWDSNNLACILIFPPYQHRQLGKLLMSVSYKLSGWEWEGGVIGGPEKPLSVMGRRSYHRFWSERIARFILGESTDADGRKVLDEDEDTEMDQQQRQQSRNDETPGKRRRRNGTITKRTPKRTKEEALTIKEIGERTGMLAEDVIAAVTEMGVCEVISPPPPPSLPQQQPLAKKLKLTHHRGSSGGQTKKNMQVNGHRPTASLAGRETEDTTTAAMVVKRSRVIEWVDTHRVGLHDPVREEGFLGEWAMSDASEIDMDVDVDGDGDGDGEGAEGADGAD